MKVGFLALLSLLVSSHLSAEDFYLKQASGLTEKISIQIERNDAGDLKFSTPEDLSRFTQTDKSIADGWISRREPSEVEQIVDAAFMALTGLLIIGIHDSYDINSELRLSKHSGVILFFFPFRDYNLYAHCGGDHHLIATTNEPNEETLKRMKSLEELREICQKPSQQEPQQDEEIKS